MTGGGEKKRRYRKGTGEKREKNQQDRKTKEEERKARIIESEDNYIRE